MPKAANLAPPTDPIRHHSQGGDIISKPGGDYSSEQGGGIISELGSGFPRNLHSAGVGAGIDLALALVEEDHGHAVALEVARRLVVCLKRPGGQAQFSRTLRAQVSDPGGDFAALHAWIADHLATDLRVERLAERSAMSPRSFARLYTARTSRTPARMVEAMRLDAARRLMLEQPATPVARIAERCGFGDDERMRRAFLRGLGVPPSDYRERFGVWHGTVPAAATSRAASA